MIYYLVTLTADSYPSSQKNRDGISQRKYLENWEVKEWDKRYRIVDDHLTPVLDAVRVRTNEELDSIDVNNEIGCSVMVEMEKRDEVAALRKGKALILDALGDKGNKLYFKDTD